MSNYPHSTSLASSLSASPYATQSNLETLINNARAHPHPRRRSSHASERFVPSMSPITAMAGPDALHPDVNGDSLQPGPGSRRQSELQHLSTRPRISTIREASYNDGAVLLLDDSDDEADADERTKLVNGRAGAGRARRPSEMSRTSRTSRASRRNYGGTSEPLTLTAAKPRSRRGSEEVTGKAGTSRSRSTARTPPRKSKIGMARGGDEAGSESATDDDGAIGGDVEGEEMGDAGHSAATLRGRQVEERPISRSSSPYTTKSDLPNTRRLSVATRFADDSSGDEGGDVARGLVATGGASMLGVRGGMGMTPISGQVALGAMEVDPAEELAAEDLEVPLDDNGLEVRDWTEAMRAEMAIVLRSGITVFFTQLAEWSLVLSSVISIGHLGTTELAASSLASMTASVSSFSILQGLATALDTLLPAAWTSSDPSRVGLWTQRMAVVMLFSTIPMYVFWWNVKGMLLALGQEEDVAELASTYLRYLSFGIPGYGGNVVVKKFLQAQNLMSIPTYTLFIVAPLNVFFNYLFVWGPDAVRIGFAGGAIATALSYTLSFLILLGWALVWGPKEAMHPLRFSHLFSKLGTVTSLGLAGTIMVSSEWWAWEACALAASILGPVSLAAQSVLLSTTSTFFQVPAALGIASAVRVGNLLGAGRGWEAKWASRACLLLSVMFATLNSLICVVFRKNWGYLFNDDPEVVAIVASIMPYIGLFQITDGVAATAGSVLRSLGLHTTGALINLTSYYIIGLPFGLWLTFQPDLGLGLKGIWFGLSVALGYASIASFVLVWRTNWTRAVERVRERLGLPTQGQIGEDGKWDGEGYGGGYEDDYAPGLGLVHEEDEGAEREAGQGERERLIRRSNGETYGAVQA